MSQQFWRNPNLTDVNHSHSSSISISGNPWPLKLEGRTIFATGQWLTTVIGGADGPCKRLNKDLSCVRGTGHIALAPWGPPGLSTPCGQLLDVIFIAIFTGYGLAATLMLHRSSWMLYVPGSKWLHGMQCENGGCAHGYWRNPRNSFVKMTDTTYIVRGSHFGTMWTYLIPKQVFFHVFFHNFSDSQPYAPMQIMRKYTWARSLPYLNGLRHNWCFNAIFCCGEIKFHCIHT